MLKILKADLHYFRYYLGSVFLFSLLYLALSFVVFQDKDDKFFQMLTAASGFVMIMTLLISKHNRLSKQNLQIFRVPVSLHSVALSRIFFFCIYWLAVIILYLLAGSLARPSLLSAVNLIEMLKLTGLMVSLMASYMIMLDLANLLSWEYQKIIFILIYGILIYVIFASLGFAFAGSSFDFSLFAISFGFRDMLALLVTDSLSPLWCLLLAVALSLISVLTYSARKSYNIT